MRSILRRATFGPIFLAAAILSLAFTATPAGATGLGLFFTYGSGSSEFDENWDYPRDTAFFEISTEGDSEYTGLGFVLDTAVARDRVFNYRLNIAFESLEYEADSVFNESFDIPINVTDFQLDIDRFVIDNTFGFGIVRLKYFRLWLGPQIRFGLMWGDGSATAGTQRAEYDLSGFVLGFAPVLGFNIHTPGPVSFGVDLGYRWSYMGGNLDKDVPGYSDEDNFDFREESFFINFALLFRINDYF